MASLQGSSSSSRTSRGINGNGLGMIPRESAISIRPQKSWGRQHNASAVPPNFSSSIAQASDQSLPPAVTGAHQRARTILTVSIANRPRSVPLQSGSRAPSNLAEQPACQRTAATLTPLLAINRSRHVYQAEDSRASSRPRVLRVGRFSLGPKSALGLAPDLSNCSSADAFYPMDPFLRRSLEPSLSSPAQSLRTQTPARNPIDRSNSLVECSPELAWGLRCCAPGNRREVRTKVHPRCPKRAIWLARRSY
jgi:hypothetical protein